MQTHIDLFFGDGEYTFALKLPQIIAIEDKCGPIGEVYSRLLKGRYIGVASVGDASQAAFKHADLVEVVRQGLIGGGKGMVDGQPVEVTSLKANRLIESYVLGRPLREAWDIAATALLALIEGYEPVDDVQKKSMPTSDAPLKARRSRSTGASSSPTVQQ